MDKEKLIDKIKNLQGLTNDEKMWKTGTAQGFAAFVGY